jgi:hypothetical protein
MFPNFCCDLFVQSNFPRNYEMILKHLHFKKLYSRRQHLEAWLIVNVSRQIANVSTVNVLMSQVIHQNVLHLQTASADLWTFVMYTLHPSSLLKFYSVRGSCYYINVLSTVYFCSFKYLLFSLVFNLAFVLYTFRLLAAGKHSNK